MAMDDGNDNIRLNKEQAPIFACRFPRYLPNGDWWHQDSAHLSENKYIAEQQLIHVGVLSGKTKSS